MDVTSIDVVLPEKTTSRSASFYGKRKPQARIDLDMENSETWTLYTTTRVARLFRAELPECPKSYDEILAFLQKLERKVSLTTIGELLSRRDHSKGELCEKLVAQGFRLDVSEASIARAEELGLVDDLRFAERFISQKKLAGWGRRRIELELRRKHISTDAILGYPELYFSEEDAYERAMLLLERKRIPEKDPYPKLCAFLVRKGYSYSVSSRAVKERLSSED